MCHFKTAIFNTIVLIGIFTSSKDNALRWMPWDLTNDKSALVQVMAWCRQATSHYLSQCWPSSMSPYGVNKPQWINLRLPYFHISKGVLLLISTPFSIDLALIFPILDWIIQLLSNTFNYRTTVFPLQKNYTSNHFKWVSQGLPSLIIPPEQQSCWGLYWFHSVRLYVRPSVRPSVRLSRLPCPLCNIYSSECILPILATNDHYHERVYRTQWPLTLTYIFKVIWPWLRKWCPLCSIYISGWILFIFCTNDHYH